LYFSNDPNKELIDAMAKYMMEQAADAPKENVASLGERQLLEIE